VISSVLSSCSHPGYDIPALFTTTSTTPSSASHAANIASIERRRRRRARARTASRRGADLIGLSPRADPRRRAPIATGQPRRLRLDRDGASDARGRSRDQCDALLFVHGRERKRAG
jgi:hypothetical protein